MSRSQHIRVEDVRAMLRIVGELHELPPDPQVRGQHLMSRLCELVDAKLGVVGIIRPVGPDGRHELLCTSVGGWVDEHLQAASVRYLQTDSAGDPVLAKLKDFAGRTAALMRPDFFREREWYRHEHVMEWRHFADLDDFLVAVHPLPEPGLLASFALNRPWGARKFGQRERNLIEALNSELGWFYRQFLGGLNGSPLSKLSPQLKRTLHCLLAGASEKQVARRLGLSPHTVHGYVKELHKRFGVSSRAELLAMVYRESTRANHTAADGTDEHEPVSRRA